MSNLDQFINKLWQEVHVATSHLTAEDKEDAITTLQSKLGSLPNDNTRDMDANGPTIRAFYDLYKKSYGTPLCWDCALFRVLGYTEKYDDKRNG